MGKNKRDKRDKKPKPMAGPRIQSLCPALKGWRVLLLELDDDDNPVMDEDDENAKHSLVDIAFWALLVEEDQANRYQEMLPCVPTTEGTMEPVDPEDPCFIAIVTPSETAVDITKMVEDYVAELPEMLNEDTPSDEEGDDDDQD